MGHDELAKTSMNISLALFNTQNSLLVCVVVCHFYKILFLGPILNSKMVVYKFAIPGACILAPVLGGHSGGR